MIGGARRAGAPHGLGGAGAARLEPQVRAADLRLARPPRSHPPPRRRPGPRPGQRGHRLAAPPPPTAGVSGPGGPGSAGSALQERLAFGLGEATPDPVGLADLEREVPARHANRTVGADRLRPVFAGLAFGSGLGPDRRVEQRGSRASAAPPGAATPRRRCDAPRFPLPSARSRGPTRGRYPGGSRRGKRGERRKGRRRSRGGAGAGGASARVGVALAASSGTGPGRGSRGRRPPRARPPGRGPRPRRPGPGPRPRWGWPGWCGPASGCPG